MRSITLIVTGILVATFSARASAEDAPVKPPTTEERLDKLEQEVQRLRKENEELRRTLGVEGRAAEAVVKPAGKEPTLQVGGLLQVQGEAGDKGDTRYSDKNDRVYLRRARINASGRFLEDFDFRAELELAGTLANTGSLRAQMTDGYVTWNHFSFLNVRGGQFKTPFGYEQLYADPRLFMEERSLVNDRLTFGRQLGVQASGDFLEKRLTYASGSSMATA